MRKLIAGLLLALCVGCGPAVVHVDAITPQIAVIDAFWEQRRASVPEIPDDYQPQAGSMGDSGDLLAQAPGVYDVSKYVHHLMVNGRCGGSAVTVGPSAYITAEHIFCDEHGHIIPVQSLQIDNLSVSGTVSFPSAGDLAVIHTPTLHSPAVVQLEPPVKGDRVLLYGMRTASIQTGTVEEVGNDCVCVLVDGDNAGIFPGDSGGGVFTEDGKLLGVLSAYFGSENSHNANHRRVYYAPLHCVSDTIQALLGASESVPEASGEVQERFPRLILFTDTSYCPPCRTQAGILKQFEDWDTNDYWKIGESADCHIQVLKPEGPLYEKLTPGHTIPVWVRVTRDGEPVVVGGVLSKERIAELAITGK